MTQLELKHLVPYLPYGLKLHSLSEYRSSKVIVNWGVRNCSDYPLMTYEDGTSYGRMLSEVKPILRPVSDLTKEIEINGIRFEPSYWFEIGDDENDSLEFDFGNIKLIKQIEDIAQNECHHDLQFLPYFVINKLFEWHFDVFDLIGAGLAIDINTI